MNCRVLDGLALQCTVSPLNDKGQIGGKTKKKINHGTLNGTGMEQGKLVVK